MVPRVQQPDPLGASQRRPVLTWTRTIAWGATGCACYAWAHLLAASLLPLFMDDLLFDLSAGLRLPWGCMAAGATRTDASLLLLSDHWIPDGSLLPLVIAAIALTFHSVVYVATAVFYLTFGHPPYLRDLVKETGPGTLGLRLWAVCAWRAGWVLPALGLTWTGWLRWFQVDLPSRMPVGVGSVDLRGYAWAGALGALALAYSVACGAAIRAYVAQRVRPDERRCWKCGYYLTGLVSQRCPECGRLVDGRCAGRLRLGKGDHPLWIAARWALAATCLLVMVGLPILGPVTGYVVRSFPVLHRFGALVPLVSPSRSIGVPVRAGARYTLVSSNGTGEVEFAVAGDGSWTYESTWHPTAPVTSQSDILVPRRGVLVPSRLGQIVEIGPWQLPCTPVTKSRAWVLVDQPGLTLRCACDVDQARRTRP